MALVTRI